MATNPNRVYAMKKILASWHLLLGLILGLGLGLVISWTMLPQTPPAISPARLRNDFKDSYRALIAAAYASTGDLPRAKSRLATLNDPDSVVAIKSQAQRALAEGDSPESLDALAALAANLEQEVSAKQSVATQKPTRTPHIASGRSSASRTSRFVHALQTGSLAGGLSFFNFFVSMPCSSSVQSQT